jgi:hypothetical protein
MTGPATITVAAGQPGTRWHDLTVLASREQHLLTAALESLFTAPHIDAQISRALDYPAWPQPLTALPVAAPDLTAATPQLWAYLDFVPDATGQALALVDRHGWPDTTAGPAASDAAWLLLQHGDHRNDDRRALLPLLAAAVSRGHADPRHLALLTDRAHTVSGQPQQSATLRLIRDEQPVLLCPTARPDAAIDRDRARIGLPCMAEDARYAYSPLNPYGAARSCPTNPWRPNGPTVPRPNPVPAPSGGDLPHLPDGAVGVYLAATLRYRNRIRRVRDQLPAPLTSTSRWLDLDPLSRASCQLDAGLATAVCAWANGRPVSTDAGPRVPAIGEDNMDLRVTIEHDRCLGTGNCIRSAPGRSERGDRRRGTTPAGPERRGI